jgi:hypothetical protein
VRFRHTTDEKNNAGVTFVGLLPSWWSGLCCCPWAQRCRRCTTWRIDLTANESGEQTAFVSVVKPGNEAQHEDLRFVASCQKWLGLPNRRNDVCPAAGWCELCSANKANAVYSRMRFIYVAAAVGIAITVPVVPMGASPAHADTGVNGYAQCIGNGAKPPPPGVSAENWFPSVHVIDNDIGSAVPPAQVVQRLVEMGVKPDDAVRRVQCYLVNLPH